MSLTLAFSIHNKQQAETVKGVAEKSETLMSVQKRAHGQPVSVTGGEDTIIGF
jgi:hypothetical protein